MAPQNMIEVESLQRPHTGYLTTNCNFEISCNDSTLTGQRYDLGKTNFAQSLLFGRELSAFHLNFRLVTLLLMGSAKIHFFLFLFLFTTPILETSDGMLQLLRCEFAFISTNRSHFHAHRAYK